MSLDESQMIGTWDHSLLPSNVRTGSDCWLERYSSFARFRSEHNPGLNLGNRVRIYTWTAFNVEPSGFIEIGDDSILVGAVFMCARRISIGRRVTISYHVTLADSDFHPVDPELRRRDAVAVSQLGDNSQRPPYESQPIDIGDDVWIGIGALILKGVTIGAGARIEAGAVVTSDVPTGCTMAGNPARLVDRAKQSNG